MISSKDIFMEQQIEDYNSDRIYIEADLWEQEERFLRTHKHEPVGKRFLIFKRSFRFRNRRNKLNLNNYLPF